MTPVSITWRRTISRARNLVTTAISIAGYLSASAVLFAFRLESAEGSHQLLSVVWASAAAPFLPVLAALLGMDVWSDERRSGRLDMLLTVSVKERDFVIGKFLGVLTVLSFSVILSLASTLVVLSYLAPMTLNGVHYWTFVPAVLALAIQGVLWSAVSVMFSTMSRQSFVAAALTTSALVAIPRGLWEGALAWGANGRTSLGSMPLDAHVEDLASGVFAFNTLLTYSAFTMAALFVAVKVISLYRFPGRGATAFRFSTLIVIALTIASAVATSAVFMKLNWTLDLPVATKAPISPRLKNVLTESSGHVTVTAFLSRKDASFRTLSQYLRGLKRQSDAQGGVEMTLRFVDPRWDVGPAERLVRQGADENSLIFEKGHRFVAVPLADGFSDSVVASAIQRVAMLPQRRDIYWTVGHGESGYDSYGARGMSDIARELSRNGYRNNALDLSKVKSVPQDSALVIVAGAREAFSRAELDKMDGYLKAGGRILTLLNTTEVSGISAILPTWGIRPVVQPLTGAKTLSGTDVIVSNFAAHPISVGLTDMRLVFERPVAFEPSAVIEGVSGADRLSYLSIAEIGTATVVAVVERGSTVGDDLAVRPTRIVAVGDASFVMNGQLTVRANANRDFFMNVVSYLSGIESPGSEGTELETIKTGMDRALRARYAAVSAVGMPFVVFIILALIAIRRRRR